MEKRRGRVGTMRTISEAVATNDLLSVLGHGGVLNTDNLLSTSLSGEHTQNTSSRSNIKDNLQSEKKK
jgi:hypothetical protein